MKKTLDFVGCAALLEPTRQPGTEIVRHQGTVMNFTPNGLWFLDRTGVTRFQRWAAVQRLVFAQKAGALLRAPLAKNAEAVLYDRSLRATVTLLNGDTTTGLLQLTDDAVLLDRQPEQPYLQYIPIGNIDSIEAVALPVPVSEEEEDPVREPIPPVEEATEEVEEPHPAVEAAADAPVLVMPPVVEELPPVAEAEEEDEMATREIIPGAGEDDALEAVAETVLAETEVAETEDPTALPEDLTTDSLDLDALLGPVAVR